MRALLQLSKRISRALVFSSSSYSSLTSSRTFATLTLFSPDCHGAAITTNGNVYARPWFAIQHRGVKVNAIHLRPGNVIEKSGRIFEVVDAEHKQRGRGGAILTLELRDVDSGNKQTLRFGAEEAVERVFVEERSFTCLYTEHESVYLIDLEKFEQLEVPLSLFGQAAAYLKEEMKVKMQFFDGRPLSGSIPKQVTCIIKETQDHAATPRYKKAVLDNGLIIQVPTYVETGEEVVVNTEDGSFVTSWTRLPFPNSAGPACGNTWKRFVKDCY